jgi:hypothetical protein
MILWHGDSRNVFIRKINEILCFMKFRGVEIIILVWLLTKRFCMMTGIVWRQHEWLRIKVIIVLSCAKCIRFWKYFGLIYVTVTLGAEPRLATISCQRTPSCSLSDLGMHLCLWAFVFCKDLFGRLKPLRLEYAHWTVLDKLRQVKICYLC